MRAARVLIFDSGVGSLSIGAAIRRQMPALELVFAMDSAGFPYGDWQEAPLTGHICDQVRSLQSLYQADLIVVACNSASTTVLPALRETITVPVVGVVPAIKPAAALSQSKTIGLLATEGTLKRTYTAQLIADFASDCQIIPVSHPELAPAIEHYMWTGEENPSVWRESMSAFEKDDRFAELDTIILACTHFPLVQPLLAKQLSKTVNWIDSGEAIARRVENLLKKSGVRYNFSAEKVVPDPTFLLVLGEERSVGVLEGLAQMRFSCRFLPAEHLPTLP